MVQWGRYLSSIVGPFDKILGSTMSIGLEVLGIIDRIKASKSIPKALLDAGYSLVIDKINLRPSKISRVSRLTLTSNEIKDIMKVIRSFENRGILSATRINNSSFSSRCSHLKESFWIGYGNISVFKWRLEWYHEST